MAHDMVDRPAPDTVFGRVSSIVATSPTLSAYETARKVAQEHASGGSPKWSHSEAELRARLLRVAQGRPDPLDYALHARTILPTASFDEAGPAGIALRIGVFRAIEDTAGSSEPVSVERLSSRWVRRTATLADTQHALQYLRAPEFNVALLHECTHDVTVRALVSFLLEWDDASLARFADGEGADFAPLLHAVRALACEHEESLETGRTRLGMPAVSLVTACRVTLRRSALDAAVASAAATAATTPPLVAVPAEASPTPALFHMAPRKRRRSGSSDVDVAQYGKVRRRLLSEFDAVTDTNGTDPDEVMAEETNNTPATSTADDISNADAATSSTADNSTVDGAAVEPNNAVAPNNADMDTDDDDDDDDNNAAPDDDDNNAAAADGAAAAVEPSNNADMEPDDDFTIECPDTDNDDFFTARSSRGYSLFAAEQFYTQYYPLNTFRPCSDPIVRVDLLMTGRSHVLLRNHFRDVSRLAGAAHLSTERDTFCWSDRIADSFWEHFRAVAHAVVTNQLTDELIDAMRAPPAEEPPYSGAPLAAYEWRRQRAQRTFSYHPYDPNDGAAVLQARAAKAGGNGAAANGAKAADDDGMDDEDGAGAEAMLEERAKTAPLEGPWTDGSVKFITGHACSGKTSLLRELEQHGWRHYSRGDLGSFAGKAKSAATVATLYGAQQYAQSMPDVLGDRGTLDNLLWEFMMQAMATEHYPSTNGACNADDFIRMLRQFLDSTFNEAAIAAFVAHKALIVVDPFCELNRIRQLRRGEEGDAFRARIPNYSTVQCLGYYAIARLLGYPVIVPYLRMPPTTEEDGGGGGGGALSPYQFDVQIGCCFARNYFGTPSSCVYSELRRSRYRKPVDGPVPDFSYAVATGFYK